MVQTPSVLALDIGDKRVGLAIASFTARLPRPLSTLERDNNFFNVLEEIIKTQDIMTLVVGFPRGMQGQHTSQTSIVEDFADQLKDRFAVPVYFQDEAVTSLRAKAELEARGKAYQKGDIDALAATFILEDWLGGQKEPAA